MGYLPEDVKMEVSLHDVQAGYFGEGDTRVRDSGALGDAPAA